MSVPALKHSVDTESRAPFLAFAADEVSREVIAKTASAAGFGAESVMAGGVERASAQLAEIVTPEVLVVDLDGVVSAAEAVERLSAVCDPGVHVVLIGTLNDVGFYRDLKAAGVAEYLVKPLNANALVEALRKPEPAVEQAALQETPEKGMCIGVVGARGGVGATTVATSLAWVFARERDVHTALVDFDEKFGSIALALDLEPNRGLADAMASPERVDDLFIERATMSIGENLGVLASESDPATSGMANEAPKRLMRHLCQSFTAVVMDTPRQNLSLPGALNDLDHLVIVTEPTLAGLRDAVRLKTAALELGCEEAALHIVVNRAGLLPKAELNAKTMTAGGKLKVAHWMPFDGKSATAAMTKAKPVVAIAPKSKIGKSLRALALDLLPNNQDASRSLMKRLLGRAK